MSIDQVSFTRMQGRIMQSAGTAVLSSSGLVHFVGMPADLATTLQNDGVVGAANKGRLFPADGRDFLQACTIQFRGGYIQARPVVTK